VKTGRASRIALALLLAFLYAPVAVLVVYSFNDARFGAAWEGFTLRWYARLLDSPETVAALQNTLVVSLSATLLATLLGTLLALGLWLRRFPGRGVAQLLILLPIVAPDILLGVALLAFYVAVHLPLGRLSIVLAHVAFQISFVVLVVQGRLQSFPRTLIEAARDLGAGEAAAVRHVVLPLLRPAVLAGALLALALSIDDFLVTYFTAGAGASTLPLRIYSMVKRGVTPDVNALSTLLLLASLAATAAALRLRRAGPERGR